jgi:hypothetical protein
LVVVVKEEVGSSVSIGDVNDIDGFVEVSCVDGVEEVSVGGVDEVVGVLILMLMVDHLVLYRHSL